MIPLKPSKFLILLGLVPVMFATPDAAAGPPAASQRLARCDHYMEAYARSSARKLERALAGQRYKFEALAHTSSVTVAGKNKAKHRFDLLVEKDGTAAGVVDHARTFRRSYALASTDHGPVIASHRWPTRHAIASGATCKPVSSTIAYPKVPVAAVDVEPFKLWGLRVMWHLPKDVPAAVVHTRPMAALRQVIRHDLDGQTVHARHTKTNPHSHAETP